MKLGVNKVGDLHDQGMDRFIYANITQLYLIKQREYKHTAPTLDSWITLLLR